ncbi:MAG: hypothetical protein ACLFRG_09705 [Desulfococcaceae bacterium]
MKTFVSPPAPETDVLLRVFNAGLFALDGRGLIRSASQSVSGLTGPPASDLAGRSWRTLFGPTGGIRHRARPRGRRRPRVSPGPRVPPEGEERFLAWVST